MANAAIALTGAVWPVTAVGYSMVLYVHGERDARLEGRESQ